MFSVQRLQGREEREMKQAGPVSTRRFSQKFGRGAILVSLLFFAGISFLWIRSFQHPREFFTRAAGRLWHVEYYSGVFHLFIARDWPSPQPPRLIGSIGSEYGMFAQIPEVRTVSGFRNAWIKCAWWNGPLTIVTAGNSVTPPVFFLAEPLRGVEVEPEYDLQNRRPYLRHVNQDSSNRVECSEFECSLSLLLVASSIAPLFWLVRRSRRWMGWLSIACGMLCIFILIETAGSFIAGEVHSWYRWDVGSFSYCNVTLQGGVIEIQFWQFARQSREKPDSSIVRFVYPIDGPLGINDVPLSGFRFKQSPKGSRIYNFRVMFPAILLAILFAAPPIYQILRYRKKARRLRLGLCATCGYDLRGSAGHCPECGRDIATVENKISA